jgi:hypothetical protein
MKSSADGLAALLLAAWSTPEERDHDARLPRQSQNKKAARLRVAFLH